MEIKSAREYGFGAWIDQGKTKEEIIDHFALTEKEYEKSLRPLNKIREKKDKGDKIIIQERTARIELTEEEFTAIRDRLKDRRDPLKERNEAKESELPDSVKQIFRIGRWDPANRKNNKKRF